MKAKVRQTRDPRTPGQVATDSPRGILSKTTLADRGRVDLPVLAPHLVSHVIGEQLTLLVSESFDTLLKGGLYCDLLPLLDGRRPLAGIVADLEGRHPAARVEAAVVSLSHRGYVVSADHGMERSRAAYWSSLGATPRWVEQRLSESAVSVEGDEGRLERQLEARGAIVAADDPRLTVIVCEDYLESRFDDVNRRQLAAKTPWTLVRPHGIDTLFGPIFRTDEQGPCWDCLATRLRSHKEVHEFLRHVAGEEAAFKPFAGDSASLEAVYGLIAAEIVRWLVLDENAPIHDQAISMDVGEFAISKRSCAGRSAGPAATKACIVRIGRRRRCDCKRVPSPTATAAARGPWHRRLPWRSTATWSAQSAAL